MYTLENTGQAGSKVKLPTCLDMVKHSAKCRYVYDGHSVSCVLVLQSRGETELLSRMTNHPMLVGVSGNACNLCPNLIIFPSLILFSPFLFYFSYKNCAKFLIYHNCSVKMNNKETMDNSQRVKEDFIRFGNSLLNLVAERMFSSTLQYPNTAENISSVFEAVDTISNNLESCNSPEAEQQEILQTSHDNSSSEADSSQSAFEDKVDNTCLASMTWPDGNYDFVIPPAQLSNRSGKQTCNFGWAFCCSNSKFIKRKGITRRYLHCLGVFKCHYCTFVARPLIPKNKTRNALPLAPKHTCPLHPSDNLQFLPCTGHLDGPCTLTIDIHLDKVLATHMGQHNHPRPPITKPSPEALQELAQAVKTNPAAGPAKLRIGVPGCKPMPEVSDAFLNQD